MESDEHETDDLDDTEACKRRRKCWKQHRVDAMDGGMYACDQCEKLFNKQSSLARHKYEHSGKHACLGERAK